MEWFTSLGWFWKFWIISSIVSLLIGEISVRAMVHELKREYDMTSEKAKLSESVRSRFGYIVPFFNIVSALMWIFAFNYLKKEAVKEAMAKGYIWKKKKENEHAVD